MSTTGSNQNPAPPAADVTTLANAIVSALQSGSTGTTTPAPVTPPIMGGVANRSGTEQAPWTGGKPKHDWSGLDDTADTEVSAPTQYRSTTASIGSQQKSYAYRIKGMDIKMSATVDLTMFQKNFLHRLQREGLDTISYIPSPTEPTKMISCVTDHTRLTFDVVVKSVEAQASKYDSYDKSNDKDAVELLLNSLAPELRKEVSVYSSDHHHFPILWMRAIKCIQTVSIDHFDNLKKTLRDRKASDYPGQNLAALAAAYQQDAQALETGGQYEHKITKEMIDVFISSGNVGNSSEASPALLGFRNWLLSIRADLEKKLVAVGYLSSADASDEMTKAGLHYTKLLETVAERYRNLVSLGQWPPARSNPDSKAAPQAFGNVASVDDVQSLNVQLNALLQTLQKNGENKSDPKSNSPCNICGKLGHWANECPQKRNGKSPRDHRRRRRDGRGPRGRPGRGDRGGKRGRDNDHAKTGWKYQPPGPGDPQTKHVNGHNYQWCEACQRFSTTHGTATHRGPKPTDDSKDTSAPQTNYLVVDPSAWCLPLDLCGPPSWASVFRHLILPFFSSSMFLVIVALVFGWVLGTMTTPMDILLHLKSNFAWYLTLGNIGTLLHGSRSLGRHSVNNATSAKPPDPGPLPRWARRKGPRFRRRIARRLAPHCTPRHRPRRRKNQVAHNKAARQGLAKRRRQRWYNHHSDLATLLSSYSKSLEFRWVPSPVEEGEGNASNSPFRSAMAGSNIPRRRTTKYRPRGRGRFGLTAKQKSELNHFPNRQLTSAFMGFSPIAVDLPQSLKAAMTALQESRQILGKDGSFPVIFDSGASISVSPYESDFVGELKKPSLTRRLQGIAKGLEIKGEGHVAYSFQDVNGMLRTIKVPALLVPKCQVRLLSTSSYLQTYHGETIQLDADRLRTSGCNKDGQILAPFEVKVCPNTNLPIGMAYTHEAGEMLHTALNLTISTVSEANGNLSEAQKELLRWHYRLGHLSMKRVQHLLRTGALAHTEGARRRQAAACKVTDIPMCSACQYGKQRRRTTPGHTHKPTDKVGNLKKDQLFAGQKVSVDHFVCSTRGRLPHTFGKEDHRQRYTGGALFTDHASGYTFVTPQVHLNTHETLESKKKFESHCRDFGVVVQTYLSDNGSAFSSSEYQAHLEQFSQINKFAGVGAHHHNGVAERNIQTIMSVARTMMLHAAIHWAETADAALWPLAVQYAVYLHSRVPDSSSGLAPLDLFSRLRSDQSRLQQCHVWGCPVYVLDNALADGKKLPRWKPRSSRYVFVGMSSKHASTVPLVLNLETGAISPQFHIVFDDWFTTVATNPEDLPDFGSAEWEKLFGDSTYQYVIDDVGDTNDADAPSATPSTNMERQQAAVVNAQLQHAPPQPLPVPTNPIIPPTPTPSAPPSPSSPPSTAPQLTPPTPPSQPPIATSVAPPLSVPLSHQPGSSAPPSPSPVAVSPQREHGNPPSATGSPPTQQREKNASPPPQPKPKPAPTVAPVPKVFQPTHPPRRSTRARTAPTRLGYDGSQGHGYLAHFERFHETQFPAAFKAKVNRDPDTLTWDEAMRSPERELWLIAAKEEIDALVKHGTWVEVPIESARGRIVPGTWVFRRKRTPDGEIKKYKGRYTLRGDLQDDMGDTYAPVVAWSTVRLFLVLSMVLDWPTVSVDFSNAFIHATLPKDKPMWIHLPRGFSSTNGKGTCFKLIKSLYGSTVAPYLWFKTVSTALLSLGFKQCEQDQCLFYKPGMMLVLYVDDAGIAAKDPADIDKLVDDLRKKGFRLEKEGSFAEFLGIKFERTSSKEFVLTQKGLIDKIIEATGLQNANPNNLPGSRVPLAADPEGAPMSETWHYPSICGMLLYLSCNTRVDIAVAVSQVCRFNSNPKQSHAVAIKKIVRYLKATRDFGMIYRPTGKLDLDLYVDADFCGLQSVEDPRNPVSAACRMGMIVMLSGCPTFWKTGLLKHICLSTLEAEYSSLSTALKTLLPMKRLLLELVDALAISEHLRTSVRARAFEDNQGALLLAQSHRVTNRTKYFLARFHWFWQHASEFELHPVETKRQLADFLTKISDPEQFALNRLGVQGW